MTTSNNAILDPDRFPKPPFRQQPQQAPGLASEMDPAPDHGEKAIAATVV